LPPITFAKFHVREQRGHLAFLNIDGQSFTDFRGHYFLHGVLEDFPAFFQKAKIGFQARQPPIDGAWTLASLHEGHYPGPYMQMPHLGSRGKAMMLRNMSNKLMQVAGVGGKRIRRKTAFERQISEKRCFVKHVRQN